MRRAGLVSLLLAVLAVAGLNLSSGPGPAGGAAPSLQERIDAASPGDTLYVDGGVFRERIVIDKPLTLTGQGGPVIDAGGQGDVLTIRADDVSVTGFTIRGSSRSISQEPAAVKVEDSHNVTLRSNTLRDAHFGIHMTGSHHAMIAFNDIRTGSDTTQDRRGHGIYMWNTGMSLLYANDIRDAADGIHLEFSDGNRIAKNTVTDSRYALHFMYAKDNVIKENVFRDNLSGAVLMFSQNLVLKDNEMSSNRRGATGAGILLKDVDDIFAEGNRVLRNKFGLAAEGSPQAAGASAVFLRNLFALNDTGIGLMSTSPITFVENAMIENTVQVKALSGSLGHSTAPEQPPAPQPGTSAHSGHAGHGGQAGSTGSAGATAGSSSRSPVWAIDGRGNYWSDYRGYDANRDGVGDRPYRPQPPFAGALSSNDELRVFQFTLAQQAIDAASDFFPLYRYEPVISDTGPLMQPPGPTLPRQEGFNKGLLVVSALLLVLSAALAQAVLDIDLLQPLRRLWQGKDRLGREGSV